MKLAGSAIVTMLTPASVLAAIPKHLPAANPEFIALARELAARCEDFRRLDALYDSHAWAWMHFNDAYYGIVETAQAIHVVEERAGERAIRQWVADIYEPFEDSYARIETPVAGLSPAFGAMREQWLTSSIPCRDIEIRRHQSSQDRIRAVGRHVHASFAITNARAATPGDRALMRLVIEQRMDGKDSFNRILHKCCGGRELSPDYMQPRPMRLSIDAWADIYE